MKKVTEERLKKSQEDSEGNPAAPTNQRKRTKDDANQPTPLPPSKKMKTQNPAAVKKTELDGDKFVKPAPVANPQVGPQAGPQAEPQIDPRAAAKRPDDPTRQARTVFVSNLDFALKESDIRAVLSSSGTITDIRLVLDFKKRSKGYCYVEFSTEVSRFTTNTKVYLVFSVIFYQRSR